MKASIRPNSSPDRDNVHSAVYLIVVDLGPPSSPKTD
jgi:hypothetical protein